MKKDKVLILLDRGDLIHCPSAYIEVRVACFVGGKKAREGYHIHPRVGYSIYPSYSSTLLGESVESLKKRIEALFPEEKYIKEYV